jgi:predicted ribosomally synthesized peptide with nif11-like leader
MAKENVKKFFEEVSKNEDLQKQLKEATEKNEAEIAKAVKAQTEAVVSLAKGAGFDFTADELLSASAPKDSKLDMNELDAVAGGAKAGSGRTLCLIFGASTGPNAGAGSGGDAIGATACAFIGLGIGAT